MALWDWITAKKVRLGYCAQYFQGIRRMLHHFLQMGFKITNEQNLTTLTWTNCFETKKGIQFDDFILTVTQMGLYQT